MEESSSFGSISSSRTGGHQEQSCPALVTHSKQDQLHLFPVFAHFLAQTFWILDSNKRWETKFHLLSIQRQIEDNLVLILIRIKVFVKFDKVIIIVLLLVVKNRLKFMRIITTSLGSYFLILVLFTYQFEGEINLCGSLHKSKWNFIF